MLEAICVPYLKGFVLRWEATCTADATVERAYRDAEKMIEEAKAKARALAKREIVKESIARMAAAGPLVLSEEEETTAEALEEIADEERYQRWVGGRVWCSDFSEAAPYAVEFCGEDDDITICGYVYPDGGWIRELDDGRYWTMFGHGDFAGTLTECEQGLWENHSESEYGR